MKLLLEVLESTQSCSNSDENCITKQVKITNISNTYLNDLTLYIEPIDIPILEKSIIRARGALSFNDDLNALDIGNLAPEETAYFTYQFKPLKNIPSLSPYMTISFTPETSKETSTITLTNLLDITATQ